ncbi:MAG: hypothetical protein ACLFWB_13260, partial [Armatimonadota bacterium]
MSAKPHRDTPITMRPHHMLCLYCLKGGGDPPDRERAGLDDILKRIEEDRNTIIKLDTAFNCMGGPTTFPDRHTPETRRKDLQVLRDLNLVPDATRSAYWMIHRWIPEHIPSLEGICRLQNPEWSDWEGCPVAETGAYEKGIEAGLCRERTEEEMQQAKRESVQMMEETDRMQIRAHHLLCMMCYYGSGKDEPLAADNLWEAILRIACDPEVEIELIEGACMICPPCPGYDPERGICDTGCGLRDRLKDLNTFQILGFKPGDVVTGREVYDLIWERIPDVNAVCANRDDPV